MSIFNFFRGKQYFLLGIIFLIFIYLPIIVMNTDMLNIIHDEYDGELLNYIYNAKYLDDYRIPEFLDGADKVSMIPVAPLLVYLFKFLDVPSVYFINYIFIICISYVGMYLLINKLLQDELIATVSAICFSLLPFYPMFCLSVMGQPLLFYCLLKLYYQEDIFSSYLFIFIFAGLSSMVLAGVNIVILLILIEMYMYYKYSKINYNVLIGILILVFTYIIFNIDLIYSVLGAKEGFISHRVEWVIKANGIFDSLRGILWQGQYHAASNHRIIFVAVILFIITAYIKKVKFADNKNEFMVFKFLLSIELFIALFYGLWHCEFLIEIRKLLGGFFVTFQADRFYFLNPTIWWLIFAYCIYFLKNIFNDKSKKFIVAFIIVNFLFVLSKSSTVLVNWRTFIDDNYVNNSYASINEFYQPELFDEIETYIGKEKYAYKVASIGLYPSIALYNGFYCIDGYSTNYSLEYKHKFREIISCELDKMGSRADYFDKWGHRCYIFVNDIYGEGYYIDKYSKLKVRSLSLNFNKLKEMGCQYIFSSVKIIDLQHLKLEKKFSNSNSIYDVYLYKIL